MNDKPKLLDLFCGAGGASHGYALAGFDVTGVDLFYQEAYQYNFIRMDALEYLYAHGDEYDVIHASPPCQQFSISTRWHDRKSWPNYIPELRNALRAIGKTWVMENVPNAPLENPFTLCGLMFGLVTIRHRNFETYCRGYRSKMMLPVHPPHTGTVKGGDYVTVVGHGCDNTKGNSSLRRWREVMEMPWAIYREDLTEAIPPAYTKYIGTQLLKTMETGTWL